MQSGIGDFGKSSLLFQDPPLAEMTSNFPSHDLYHLAKDVSFYKIKGGFANLLQKKLKEIIGCCRKDISLITQRIGTFGYSRLQFALYHENIYFQNASSKKETYNPNNETARALLDLLCPMDQSWREESLRLGYDLIINSIIFAMGGTSLLCFSDFLQLDQPKWPVKH